MIKFSYNLDKLNINGHALFDTYGKDIVCSSVSTLLITHVNLIELLNMKDNIIFRYKSGEFYLEILKHNEIIDKIFQNIINTLIDLKNQYPKNIMEVIK